MEICFRSCISEIKISNTSVSGSVFLSLNVADYNQISWNTETELYFLSINGHIKFGVTSNWEKRLKSYKREVGFDKEIIKLKSEKYPSYWEAEFVEQMLKWRLRKWAFDGRHEWINLPIQNIFDCYHETKEIIGNDLTEYRGIHRTKNERWGHYKQKADYLFPKD